MHASYYHKAHACIMVRPHWETQWAGLVRSAERGHPTMEYWEGSHAIYDPKGSLLLFCFVFKCGHA